MYIEQNTAKEHNLCHLMLSFNTIKQQAEKEQGEGVPIDGTLPERRLVVNGEIGFKGTGLWPGGGWR